MRLSTALRAALGAEPPASVRELVALAGGRPFHLARAMNGISAGARLPAVGTPQRRRYDADARWVQRQYGGQRATPASGQLARARGAVERPSRRAARQGVRVRVVADVTVAGYPVKGKEMPVGGVGVFLGPGPMRAVLAARDRGRWSEAAREFNDSFWPAYGPDGQIGDVKSLTIWAEGEEEPGG